MNEFQAPQSGQRPSPARFLAPALATGEDDVVFARHPGRRPRLSFRRGLRPAKTGRRRPPPPCGRPAASPTKRFVDAEQRQVVDRRADLFAVGGEQRVVVAAVDLDDRAGLELPLEQDVGELVFDVALDGAPQRPGTERGVVALVDQQVGGGVGELDRQALLGELLAGAQRPAGRR